MGEGLFVLVFTTVIYLWLSGVFDSNSSSNGTNGNQKFGDGKSRYDFKDYVNKHLDD